MAENPAPIIQDEVIDDIDLDYEFDLDLDLAIRNLKEAIEKKSSSLGKRARGDGSAGVAATKLAKQSIAAGSPGASPLL